jgi:hypothetical protein
MIWKDPTVAKILLLTLAAVLGYGATMLGPPEFHDGDLIFQETAGQQSAAVLAATGSPYTHMGIVRLSGGKPVVVEAIGPVQETPLDAWISRGQGGHYALYRMRDLSPADATRVLLAAERYYGRPYDILFRPDDDAIYCSELPHLAFSVIGKNLGEMKPLRSLKIDDTTVTALIARRWQQHPACKNAATMEECVEIIKDQPIVTPASIAADKNVDLIYSDF